MKQRSYFCSLLIFLSGCSSLNNRDKTLLLMAASGTAGAIVGAQQDRHKKANAVMYGSAAAAVGGAAGLFLFDSQKEVAERDEKLKQFRELVNTNSWENPLVHSTGHTEETLPDGYRNLLRLGEWKLFRINRWKKQNDNTLIRETEMITLMPPKLLPGESSGPSSAE
jgi:hypothetical protein